MDINRLCMGCMRELEEGDSFCPHCGYKCGEANTARALQPQTILNGKYLVGKVIGEGGFGITYIAYDLNLERRVAIKEFFPNEHAGRDTSASMQTALKVLTDGDEEQYKKGLERFSREATNLAKFSGLPGVVSIRETFYENNTAYMVMEYIEGVTLEKYLEDHGGRLPYAEVIGMMKPVMEDLEKIHKAGIIHRDISPDNIMVCNDGSMKLIDFGAARIVGNNDRKSLTIVLKHGYAPEEQYRSDGDQGPWTDVYALAATMYRMITGVVPQESTDRIMSGDRIVPIKRLVSEIPEKLSDVIMQGLAISAADRPQGIEGFWSKSEKRKGTRIVYTCCFITAAVLFLLLVIVLLMKGWEDKETSTNKEAYNENNGEKDEKEIKKTEEKKPVSRIEDRKKDEDEEDEEDHEDEVKILTEEEKREQQKEFTNAILDIIGVPLSEDQYHICYDDFDGDGDYELFMAVVPEVAAYIFYSDNDGVRIAEDGFYGVTAEDGFFEVTAEAVSQLRDEIDRAGAYGFYADFAWEELSFGTQKVISYYYYQMGNHYACYSVFDQKPQRYDAMLENINGFQLCECINDVKCFTSLGEELYTGDFFSYYAPYYIDGQFGELASCRIGEKDYESVPGLIDQIDSMGKEIKRDFTTNGYVDGGGWPFDGYNINSIVVDSIFYNEMGYFIINYKCYCSFEIIQSDPMKNWGTVRPYYVSLVENYSGDVNYSGRAEDMDTDTVAGIYAHAILAFDGEIYDRISVSNGYIGETVTGEALITSECPWVEQ